MMNTPENTLWLANWRRRVSNIYAAVRQNPQAEDAWNFFRVKRDDLFKTHPQSPLTDEQKEHFDGLDYYPYQLEWRLDARVDQDVIHETFQIQLPAEGSFSYTRIARLNFLYRDESFSLSLFWVNGYGGGLFLPFRDTSNGSGTYGGGRYLYDGIKGADLNPAPGQFTLDFNFAYNPSCAYNDHWVCPLSPAENRLSLAITAGEKQFEHS